MLNLHEMKTLKLTVSVIVVPNKMKFWGVLETALCITGANILW